MTVATFRAHCAQGHDRIDFAGSVEPVPHADRDWSEERVSNGA